MTQSKSLELAGVESSITVLQEHLEAISYLLESNIRHERTSLEEHNLHLQNAREVIEKALRADKPNQPLPPFWSGQYRK